MASDNVSLGMFNLVDIPPAPRGVPQIEVTFDIDANGILNVTAKDLGTGKEAKIKITASTKLSKEDKERMIKDAEQFAEQDKKKREEADIRNTADNLVYTAEKTKTDLADKLTTDQKAKIDGAVTSLKDALASNDTTRMKEKSDALTKVLQEIGSVVYQQAAADYAKTHPTNQQGQQGEPQQPEQEPPTGGGEKVVDSEDYKVK